MPLFAGGSEAPMCQDDDLLVPFFLVPRRDGFIQWGKTGGKKVFACVWKDDGFVWRGEGNAMFVSNDLVRCSLV